MAQDIQLEKLPAQGFVITLSENNYVIRIFSLNGSMAYDLTVNNVQIITGFKIVSEILLLPYDYQEASGNLLLIVPDDEIPDYNLFGLSQFLVFLDAAETLSYRNRVESI